MSDGRPACINWDDLIFDILGPASTQPEIRPRTVRDFSRRHVGD
ncbi:hypothetical protein [Amycolatopsis sp. cg9]